MFFPHYWHRCGALRYWPRRLTDLFLRLLDLALDFANRIEILTDLCSVARTKLSLKPRHIFHDPIQKAATLPQNCAAIFRTAPITEQAFEDHTRISLGGKRRGG